VPIYEFLAAKIVPLETTTFGSVNLQERRDLQRLLRDNIEVVAPGTLVISEEFGDWEESRRRIDLLGIDKEANLVVIEMKRTEDGGHIELQAIRYAAMVARMTFDEAVGAYDRYLRLRGVQLDNPRSKIMQFLGWHDDTDITQFANDVRIVLVSADFSREVTTTVLWLSERGGLDIRCVRLTPYKFEGHVLVDVQPIIPLPETADYLEQVREKERIERLARVSAMDRTRFDVTIGDDIGSGLTKGRAILRIFSYLCEHDEKPEDIAAKVSRRTDRTIYSLEGSLDSTAFQAQANAKGFDPRRWFYGESELVKSHGKTYAFSNQWGGDDWRAAMNSLISAYPQFKLSFSEAASSGSLAVRALSVPPSDPTLHPTCLDPA
jgi:hypothetical protein